MVLDNLSAHKLQKIKAWCQKHNVELCFTPTSANRTNVGTRNIPPPQSGLAEDGGYLRVRWGPHGGGGGGGQLPTVRSHSSAGEVSAQHADLGGGEASATLRMRRPGVAVLSALYGPGWTATVNGRWRPVRMVAPALVALDVPAGMDHVVFRFHGYGATRSCSR